jgi:hypothetical protein
MLDVVNTKKYVWKCDIKNFNEDLKLLNHVLWNDLVKDFYPLIINLQIFVTNSKNIPHKRGKKNPFGLTFKTYFLSRKNSSIKKYVLII